VQVCQVHLPAVITPQSVRQRKKMPRQQQPVPPMYTPESIASIVRWAAEQDRPPREILIGRPTIQAVWGQKFIPGLLDHYLARAGWEPQFVDEPNRQEDDMLFHPLSWDSGAHGPYRDRERGPDLFMRLQVRPNLTRAAVGLAAVAALAVARRMEMLPGLPGKH
jgi:hypothetical protein